jgi:hypothetical protein
MFPLILFATGGIALLERAKAINSAAHAIQVIPSGFIRFIQYNFVLAHSFRCSVIVLFPPFLASRQRFTPGKKGGILANCGKAFVPLRMQGAS